VTKTGAAHKKAAKKKTVTRNPSRKTRWRASAAKPARKPLAHTDRISFEALARVGLNRALAPTRATKRRFERAVGATGAAKENATINIQHR